MILLLQNACTGTDNNIVAYLRHFFFLQENFTTKQFAGLLTKLLRITSLCMLFVHIYIAIVVGFYDIASLLHFALSYFAGNKSIN